jgi:hypothetical protein
MAIKTLICPVGFLESLVEVAKWLSAWPRRRDVAIQASVG